MITFLQWLDRTLRGAGSGLRVCGGGGSPRSCSPSTSPQRSGPIFLISEVVIFTVRWNIIKETFTKSYEIKTTCKAYLYEMLLFLIQNSQVNTTLIIAEYYRDKALEHLWYVVKKKHVLSVWNSQHWKHGFFYKPKIFIPITRIFLLF